MIIQLTIYLPYCPLYKPRFSDANLGSETYLGLYTEYEMLIISFSSMVNISYAVFWPRYVFRAQISV